MTKPRPLTHLLILALICSLPLLAVLAGAPASRPSDLLGGEPPTARAAEPPAAHAAELPKPPAAQLGGDPVAAPAARRATPQAAPPQPAISSEAAWVQAFRATSLWSSERPDAVSLASLPQWSHLRQLGPHVGSRMPVEYPGDGHSLLPLRGWVESADLGPGGRPNPEHLLAAGGNVNPATGRAAPRRIVQAWPQGISAQYAVLLDEASGEVLWGRNAHGRVAPASLTKIVTTLVALDRARLTDRVTVRVDSRDAFFVESTVMGLQAGQSLSLETLLYGLMLPSGNDAALAVAQHVAGSEAAFVQLMNARVAELGLVNSRFANPHGLDAPEHYSSPYDLAMLARVGMRNPAFARLAAAREHTAEGFTLHNLNRLIGTYPKADGVKVGYTDAAGRAIVASATDGGRRLYAVLIRSANPTAESQALLEWAFRGFAWQ